MDGKDAQGSGLSGRARPQGNSEHESYHGERSVPAITQWAEHFLAQARPRLRRGPRGQISEGCERRTRGGARRARSALDVVTIPPPPQSAQGSLLVHCVAAALREPACAGR